jgi:phenylacetate-CoA ligase
MLAFNEGMRFRREAVNWELEKKREWVKERLRFAVRRAARETVHYRELFKQLGFDPQADFSFKEFSMLPVLEREDVRRGGRNLVSSALMAAQLQKDSTGGSTGVPTEVWLGPEERGWRESGTESFMRRIGVPTGTRTGLLWGHHLDPVAQDSLLERYHAFESNTHWFDCFRLSPAALEQYHHQFERWRPACIIAYASALGHHAEHILERGHRPTYPTHCFVTGAEKLLPEHRELVERAFKRPVHERYGSRDVGGMGFQLRPTRTLDYEIDWANILIEPETDERDSAILVTKLHADGMPMLRYRVGDVGRFPEGSRSGNPTFALQEVLGRETDRIWLPDGRWINAIQMPHMMKDYPVREFMLVQRSDYSVELKIVPRNGFGEETRRSILETVTANLPTLDVTLMLVEEIPRTRANKWRPVMSEVKPPQEKAVS